LTDGETLSRAGTGPPARAVGCCARVLDAPRGCPRRGGARSGPMRHPAFAREKAGTTRPNASFFAFCARGAGAGRGAAAALLVDFESGRTLLVPRLRRARSLWPGALPSRRRVRSPYRDRPRETTHARASFPRVRSDSLPAGQPSRVRGVPACLLAKRSTRLSASLLASARSPCAVVLCGVRAFRGDAKSVGQRKRSLCATVSES
jgi:hypothetical protein